IWTAPGGAPRCGASRGSGNPTAATSICAPARSISRRAWRAPRGSPDASLARTSWSPCSPVGRGRPRGPAPWVPPHSPCPWRPRAVGAGAGSAPATMALETRRAVSAAPAGRGARARAGRPVSVDKDIPEIADRCMKAPGGGPALVFTRPTLRGGGPSRHPVAVNLFGSARRMALALGVACLDEIGERIAALLNLKVPDTLLRKLAPLPQLG